MQQSGWGSAKRNLNEPEKSQWRKRKQKSQVKSLSMGKNTYDKNFPRNSTRSGGFKKKPTMKEEKKGTWGSCGAECLRIKGITLRSPD